MAPTRGSARYGSALVRMSLGQKQSASEMTTISPVHCVRAVLRACDLPFLSCSDSKRMVRSGFCWVKSLIIWVVPSLELLSTTIISIRFLGYDRRLGFVG